MSKFGAFVAGLGTGMVTGEKMRRDRERDEREREAAEQEREIRQRALDKDKKLQEAYQEIASNAVKVSRVKPPDILPGEPEPSNRDMLGFALSQKPDLLKDRTFLDGAAQAFLSRGLPEGVKWLEAGHKASQEGYMQGLQALMSDDPEAAVRAFATSGKLRGVTSVDQLEKKPDGTWAIAGANGKTMTIDPRQAYINLLPPKDFAEFQMKMPYYKALADYQGGRNQAGVDRATISGEARVEAAGISGDSRVEAAGIRAGGQVEAAGVRAAGLGTRRASGGGAGNTSVYGGDKGAAKWIEDFEKHYMPKADVKNPDGSNKIDPKTAAPVQEVDQSLAPVVRDLARVNRDVLSAGGIHPQQAANVFTQFARAFKAGDRAKMFTELDRNGLFDIVDNERADPVEAVGVMGHYRDARGQVRKLYFELPERMSDELVAQEAIRREEEKRVVVDEPKRTRGMQEYSRRAPGARQAVRGVIQRAPVTP